MGVSEKAERLGYAIAALLLASGLIHLGILLVTDGSWLGPLSLRKPTTFGLSFGLTLLAVVWVTSFLRLSDRTRVVLLGAFTAACVLETVLISLQAWRGVPSHFNVETPLDAGVAQGLAAGGVTLVVIIAALTILAFRAGAALPQSMRLSIQIGFVTLFAAQVVGALMIARGMMLVFSGNAQEAYATGGAFKPSHAATMHVILALPALAWMLSFTNLSERRRVHVVLLAAAGYAIVAGVFVAANPTGLEFRP